MKISLSKGKRKGRGRRSIEERLGSVNVPAIGTVKVSHLIVVSIIAIGASYLYKKEIYDVSYAYAAKVKTVAQNVAKSISVALGTDKLNPTFAFIDIMVNDCPVKVFYDSGATISIIIPEDFKRCPGLVNAQPSGTQLTSTNAGTVNLPLYDVTMKLPDGAPFTTKVKNTSGPYSSISTADLTKIYNVNLTATSFNLTPV